MVIEKKFKKGDKFITSSLQIMTLKAIYTKATIPMSIHESSPSICYYLVGKKSENSTAIGTWVTLIDMEKHKIRKATKAEIILYGDNTIWR